MKKRLPRRTRRPAKRHRALNRESWRRRLLRILPSLLVVVLLVLLFSHLSALHKIQAAVSDTRMRLNGPRKSSQVAIVRITNEDYQSLSIFQGRSPLDPRKLEQLLRAVMSGRPKIIGVDIDTSAPQFKDFQVPEGPTPIIWEREVNEVPEHAGMKPEPLPVLGGKDPEITERFSGMPLLIDDAEDKVTRRYRRLINTTEGPLPSFTWAIISNLQSERAKSLNATDEDLFIRYAGDNKEEYRFTLNASTVLALTKERPLPDDNPFRDKIVLIGGEYQGQDLHETPLGNMSGVMIMAQVIETELEGGGDHVPTKMTLLLLEIFEGIIAVLLFHLIHAYGLTKTLTLSLLSVFAISILCSLLAFHSPFRFTFFIPVIVCVLIFEFIVEYRLYLLERIGDVLGGKEH